MSAPIPLRRIQPKPNSDLVETLENLLKEAKAGDLRSLYYGCLYQGGQYTYEMVGDEEMYLLLIAIMSMQHTRSSLIASGPLDEEEASAE